MWQAQQGSSLVLRMHWELSPSGRGNPRNKLGLSFRVSQKRILGAKGPLICKTQAVCLTWGLSRLPKLEGALVWKMDYVLKIKSPFMWIIHFFSPFLELPMKHLVPFWLKTFKLHFLCTGGLDRAEYSQPMTGNNLSEYPGADPSFLPSSKYVPKSPDLFLLKWKGIW